MANLFTGFGGFPELPSLGNPLIAVPGGSGSPGGINIGWDLPTIPGIIIAPGGNDGKGTGTVTEPAIATGAANFLSCLLSPGTCLLRIVLLIIGLICIAGAIYLYKPTSELIAAPVRAAKHAAVAAAAA